MVKKFYPSPSVTTYYINEYLIEDMFRVDFKRSLRQQPVYGYDSQKFDFVAPGKELVVGNIVINYRYPGYLRNILKEQKHREKEINQMIGKRGLEETRENKEKQALQKMQTIDSLTSVQDKMNLIADTLVQKSIKSKNPEIARNVEFGSDLVAQPDEIFQRLKANYERRKFSADNVLPDRDISNSIMSSPLDDYNGPFDLSVKYGFQDKEGGYVRVFRDIYLIGEEETVSAQASGGDSSSASPILEIYPFFARTIDTSKSN